MKMLDGQQALGNKSNTKTIGEHKVSLAPCVFRAVTRARYCAAVRRNVVIYAIPEMSTLNSSSGRPNPSPKLSPQPNPALRNPSLRSSAKIPHHPPRGPAPAQATLSLVMACRFTKKAPLIHPRRPRMSNRSQGLYRLGLCGV